jgi:hypothetical protein
MMTTHHDPAERNVRHTRTTAWLTLILATLTSLAGNVYHATLSPAAGRASVVAAAVVPILLLLGIHLIGGLARARADGRTVSGVYRTALTAVGLLVVLVFAASFIALRDVLVIEGAPTWIAVIVPVAVDLAIGTSTLALFALKPAAEPVAETMYREPEQVYSRGPEPVYWDPALQPPAPEPGYTTAPTVEPWMPSYSAPMSAPEPTVPVYPGAPLGASDAPLSAPLDAPLSAPIAAPLDAPLDAPLAAPLSAPESSAPVIVTAPVRDAKPEISFASELRSWDIIAAADRALTTAVGAPETDAPEVSARVVDAPETDAPDAPEPVSAPRPITRRADAPKAAAPRSGAPRPTAEHRALAGRIVAAGAVKQDRATVALILAADAAGMSKKATAAAANVHHTVVTRVLATAAAPVLTAVG